jgi:hypothetical protein
LKSLNACEITWTDRIYTFYGRKDRRDDQSQTGIEALKINNSEQRVIPNLIYSNIDTWGRSMADSNGGVAVIQTLRRFFCKPQFYCLYLRHAPIYYYQKQHP